MAESATKTEEQGLYPIRTVCDITGVHPVTLRAWERRYGLVVPRRTESGHRLYSENDIRTIQHILSLLEAGISIGQVKKALQQESIATDETVTGHDFWRQQLRRMLDAIIRFDEYALDAAYSDALALDSVNNVTNRLLLPLLTLLGDRWERAEGSVAEEHFFSVFMRNKLGARFHHQRQRTGKRHLLAAGLPGELHEFGLLLFALAAQEHGYRVTLLGPDLPLEELPAAVRRTRPDAVVLSGPRSIASDELFEALAALVAALDVPVFIGGKLCLQGRDKITAAGATPLGTEAGAGLERLDSLLDISH